jgi:3-phenylpropionate/trans-cinnamate dioxygenase ferredoxin subunit
VTKDRYVLVGPESTLADGTMVQASVCGRAVLVCRTREGVFAIDGVCTHAYALLHGGRLRGHRVICPLHGASFDVRTGRVLGPPAVENLSTYRVRIRDGVIEVEEPAVD